MYTRKSEVWHVAPRPSSRSKKHLAVEQVCLSERDLGRGATVFGKVFGHRNAVFCRYVGGVQSSFCQCQISSISPKIRSPRVKPLASRHLASWTWTKIRSPRVKPGARRHLAEKLPEKLFPGGAGFRF